ncbi:hypothetical protein [Brevibacterium spongiae]|uniref:Uncharacterized protein n=1 Tax=Brevibacterium spongiae TaxID=2909672 RepID=A0ABY5SNW4_9MICO|nr:hypothetical protein [Brevibacterium spongiae]UVI35591.1 hypothetical protein L1F31_15940 [Brevibacterium spongiae]
MEITTRSIRSLAWSCKEFLDDHGKPLSISYPGSLALCILDALYSTGSHPTAVDNLVRRYIDRHGAADGAKSLRYSIAATGGPDAWAREVIHNLRPVNVQPGAMLRAEVVDRATRVMADHGIDTVDDLLAAVGDEPCIGPRINAVARDWRALPSQRSGLSWRNLLMLAGSPHFDIDYTVKGSIDRAAGWYPFATDDYVHELIAATADFLDVEGQEIRRIVWQVSRRRLLQNPKREICPWPYGLELEAGEGADAEEWASQFEPEQPQPRPGPWDEIWGAAPRVSAAPF